jgi:hypothetical protein
LASPYSSDSDSGRGIVLGSNAHTCPQSFFCSACYPDLIPHYDSNGVIIAAGSEQASSLVWRTIPDDEPVHDDNWEHDHAGQCWGCYFGSDPAVESNHTCTWGSTIYAQSTGSPCAATIAYGTTGCT